MVAALSPRNIEQRTVRPISPSSTSTPHHHSALSLSAIETPLAPAASVHRPDLTLHPRALPSCCGAHRPHHRRPQVLLHAPVACFPPPPFLCEFTDIRPHRPSLSPIPTSASTTLPRNTLAPISTPAPPASLAPHRRSPTPTAIAITNQAPVSPLPIRHPNRFPISSGEDAGVTFPGSPPSIGRNRPASRRLWLPLFWPWDKKAEWAEPVSWARSSTSVG
jgi:hypothetical protein